MAARCELVWIGARLIRWRRVGCAERRRGRKRTKETDAGHIGNKEEAKIGERER